MPKRGRVEREREAKTAEAARLKRQRRGVEKLRAVDEKCAGEKRKKYMRERGRRDKIGQRDSLRGIYARVLPLYRAAMRYM